MPRASRRPLVWNPEKKTYELPPKPKPKTHANGRRKGKLSLASQAKVSPDDPRRHGDSLEVCKAHCAALKKYWADRGYEVEARPERLPTTDDRYRMATDLVSGAPKDFRTPKYKNNTYTRTGSGVSRNFKMGDIR